MEIDAQQLKQNILSDVKIKLTEEFDKNFERKAFFTNKWKKRANPNAKGTLLMVTGTMRRSIKSEVRGNGVRFSSAVPYASIHNEGGIISQNVRAHSRKGKNGKYHRVKAHYRTLNMPQRQFVGDGDKTKQLIKNVIDKNLDNLTKQLENNLKQNRK